ncbi:hypothetical protein VOLCADRAFT_88680 [Volvox carteri f. nagariensis]|uniref:Peptidase S8/S53 domain-containing protein n=1 Tax=Volvox carteri f. nagariensis TaxID=3068 RepID=D8TPN5_VOLCA|nr:uncharacterized protein VOLCADRAFT_88680 [Volvox carteri f. nagariensis]EFJ50797.1 hypothetical protein VOLCADRAFT_88680 [Volvox carteri f. nagariensis]|eukprot:XP_002948390.1 hypothetical protein VOLCADRAFT_88680 [Volvox carteri f. nagariensis]
MGHAVLYTAKVILILLSFKAFATKQIVLRTGVVNLRAAEPPMVAFMPPPDERIMPPEFFFIISRSELSIMSYDNDSHAREIIRRIEEIPFASVLSYLPVNSLLVFGEDSAVNAIRFDLNTSWCSYQEAQKISPELFPVLRTAQGLVPSLGGDMLFVLEGLLPLLQRLATDATNQQQQDADLGKLLGRMVTLNQPVIELGGDSYDSSTANATVHRYGLLVEMVPAVTLEMLQYAANIWPEVLAENMQMSAEDVCWPVIYPPEIGVILSVYLCEEDLLIGIAWFAKLDITRSVYPMIREENMDVLASSLMQTGRLSQAQYDMTSDINFWLGQPIEMTKDEWPYWAAGLQGQGEIVGVGDSGVDVSTCYMEDPDYAGEYVARLRDPSRAPTIGSMAYWRIPSHRKIAQYAFKPSKRVDAIILFLSEFAARVNLCVLRRYDHKVGLLSE